MQSNHLAKQSSQLIQVLDVHKFYLRAKERVDVLNGISLTIDSGEFIALMGPSGSGKTTLLNLIAGIDTVDSGRVIIEDSDLSKMNESELSSWRAKNIGFVFQFYNLIPVLSAIENVALPLNLLKMSKQERLERANFSLEIVGLAERADHFPAQLSGGQEQRVAIARAIVSDPKIIVADEPTGDLDRTSATEVMQIFSRLHSEFNKTILMVTHDQVTAQYAKRLIHLDKGLLST